MRKKPSEKKNKIRKSIKKMNKKMNKNKKKKRTKMKRTKMNKNKKMKRTKMNKKKRIRSGSKKIDDESKAEESKAEESKAEEDKAEEDKAEEDKDEEGKAKDRVWWRNFAVGGILGTLAGIYAFSPEGDPSEILYNIWQAAGDDGILSHQEFVDARAAGTIPSEITWNELTFADGGGTTGVPMRSSIDVSTLDVQHIDAYMSSDNWDLEKEAALQQERSA